jgi:lysophospholipase L1-like esterase
MARAFNVSKAAMRAALSRGFKNVDAVMASPPTVGALATATAIGSPKAWPSVSTSGSSSVISGAHFSYRGAGGLIVHGASFPDSGYVRATSITDGNSPNAPAPLCVDFLFDGTTIELQFKGMAFFLRLRVDGELVSATPVTVTATGSTYFLPITFGSRAIRKISVETSGFVFGGVTTGPNDTIEKAVTPAPRCIVIGDSFVEGTGATGSNATGWVRRLGECLGISDTWASGLGGTGYLQTSGSRAKFRDRIVTDCINYNPDMYVLAGGLNDYASFTAAAIGAEVATLCAQLKAALPNANGIVMSPFWRNGVETIPTNFLDAKDAIKSAALTAGMTFVDVIEMPLTGAPQSTTLAAQANAGATSLSLVGAVPVGTTVEIGTGATRERRVTTTLTGTGPYTAAVTALTSTHASGQTVTVVGSCMWTGTGKVGATTGSGNSDLLVSNDGVHPSQAGHEMLGSTAGRIFSSGGLA